MAVEIKYRTKLRKFSERHERLVWLRERIPSEEFLVGTPTGESPDLDFDDEIETTVTIWADDADRIATEFWFKFP